MAKIRNRTASRPRSMKWKSEPNVPTDTFFEDADFNDPGQLQEAVESFVSMMENGSFLTWEAVVCQEQALSLTRPQRRALQELIAFDDDSDDILYIDETARPSQPWYTIVRKIAPRLLVEPYRTAEEHDDVIADGWKELERTLEDDSDGLSLPDGAESAIDVIPATLRHKLKMQNCFSELDGLCEEEDNILADKEEHYTVDWFLDELRDCKASVKFLGLTLNSLLRSLILPKKDEPIFTDLVKQKLGINSADDQLADYL